VNDIALNRDGVIVISPDGIRKCLSVTEVCARKIGAFVDENGAFVSGTFVHVTDRLADMPTDVIYLLPFFEPGFYDLHTGQDVRKGKLGSVYAVKDFFRLDPTLVSPPETVDILKLVSEGLIVDFDLHELLLPRQQHRLGQVADFNHFRTFKELHDWVGRDRLTQLIGRAQLRALTRRAHELNKRVIFDLVLMQTSRDCPLIEQHPEWYVLDESGRPKIHQIAWLVYSDVALLNLPFNKPLQNYLSGVAPFWMRVCDLDGVRIDASQTVDRPFLKQIKNRINQVKPDAIVLGETLCDLREAVDIPVDMIYALLVDFHRDAAYGQQYIDFLERTFGTFAPRTVAMAYFENHDSPRATMIWRERYDPLLKEHKNACVFWGNRVNGYDPPQVMALLRNLQCSLIDASAGTAQNVNLAYAIEWGSEWGEEARTDFEEPSLLHPDLRKERPFSNLVRAYEELHAFLRCLTDLVDGHIYFHRNNNPGGDPEDRVLAYTRYTLSSGLLIAHNLDPCCARRVMCPVNQLPGVFLERVDLSPVVDSYSFFFEKGDQAEIALSDEGISIHLKPLQSVMVRLVFRQ
jgi:glycosidase